MGRRDLERPRNERPGGRCSVTAETDGTPRQVATNRDAADGVPRVSAWHDVIEHLQSVAVVLGGAPVTWSEILGDITGAACVWLVARQNVWNWPLGLANNVFWGLLFWDAKLYGDSLLQVIFFALGCYGWWCWVRPTDGQTQLVVRHTSRREWAVLGALTALATAAVAAYLARHTDSPVPVADASVLTLSLAATYGQARKLLESWWVWIAVDVISVPLYASRGLYPTAALYSAFGLICVSGLVSWSREVSAAPVAPPAEAAAPAATPPAAPPVAA